MNWMTGTLGAAVLGLMISVAFVDAQPAKPQAPARTSTTAGRPLTDAERKAVEDLQAAQKQFDTDGARLMAASPDGRRRVAQAIARQFSVPEKTVNELRARRMGYGEVAITLAVSQQLLKRDRTLKQQQAIDRVLTLRKSEGWGVVARELGLKLGDVVSEVKRADKQLVKLDTVKPARNDRQEKVARAERPARPGNVEKPARIEKADKTTR